MCRARKWWKDSAYTAHILKYKYGMNPLTVTWAPHLYTDIGWKNFTNWMHVGGLDNILFTPNGKLHRLLTKLSFENLLHPFQPFIIGQRIIGPKIASRFNIPLVIYGKNQAEYGNNINENYNPVMNAEFYTVVYHGSIGRTSFEVSFPLRCFQQLSRPYLATRHCSWRYNRSTSGMFNPVLSY